MKGEVIHQRHSVKSVR